jgi:hypothetical protein
MYIYTEQTYNYFKQRFVRETIFIEKFGSRFWLLLVGWGEKFCYQPNVLLKKSTTIWQSTLSTFQCYLYSWKWNLKTIHLAYLMNEKNVNIREEKLFGVFWEGNVHNFINMFQLNCILWVYKETKFDCVGFTHLTGFSSWFGILPSICILMCVWQLIILAFTDNIWNI